MTQKGFLIAAPGSGSGKTTVSLAIMAALARRSLAVAPFKCGPDFIDPGYHKAVTGSASINLDSWMCGDEFVLKSFQTNLTCLTGPEPTVAIIEGAMGLFDGFGSSTMEGSSARIAAVIGAPVVLVVNARGMAASVAALLKGFAGFDRSVVIAGVIFNKVGSESHASLLKEVLERHCPEIACLGCIPRDETITIPSRHLGLVTVDDNPLLADSIRRLADLAERYLDLDRLVELELSKSTGIATCFISEKVERKSVRVAVARDPAFCFCYDDNLRVLEESGAELVCFSPLHDGELPEKITGIYLPGGYPELYAETLANNFSMRSSIKSAIDCGMPVYAECGGFIYLTDGMLEGSDFVGVFPTRTKMLSKRKALGYREVRFICDTIIGNAKADCRGHEFHYSEILEMPDFVERCYNVSRRGVLLADEGYRVKNCLGSYIHLHFGSNPEIAVSFLEECSKYAKSD